MYGSLSVFVQKGTLLVIFPAYESERKQNVSLLSFFSSFEFGYLSKMWYSDAVAVESAGQTSEMKTDAIL